MSNYVLDASAILALLNNEPGSEIVLNVLTEASKSGGQCGVNSLKYLR